MDLHAPAATRHGDPGDVRGWAVFLDFDGTLVDLADRPERIDVDPALPRLIESLRRRCDGAVALVTGRSLAQIETFLPGLVVDMCGLHGMERRIGGHLTRIVPPTLAVFRAALPAAMARLDGLSGVLVEDKGESVALHWRLAPDWEPMVRQVAADLVREVGPGFRLQSGKALVEIVPAEAGKGRAITSLMEQTPYKGRRPFFAGDDVTDETGFPIVEKAGGVALKVGAGETSANRRIGSPDELRRRLAAFAAGQDDLATFFPAHA